MKQLLALALALALFTVPTVALAAVDSPDLSQIFDQYEKTIVHGE